MNINHVKEEKQKQISINAGKYQRYLKDEKEFICKMKLPLGWKRFELLQTVHLTALADCIDSLPAVWHQTPYSLELYPRISLLEVQKIEQTDCASRDYPALSNDSGADFVTIDRKDHITSDKPMTTAPKAS